MSNGMTFSSWVAYKHYTKIRVIFFFLNLLSNDFMKSPDKFMTLSKKVQFFQDLRHDLVNMLGEKIVVFEKLKAVLFSLYMYLKSVV